MDFRSAWRAAWMVRARQMETDFAFWLAIIGYNRRDKSLSHRIYLVYAGIFFSIWGLAVLSLFGGITASFLQAVQPDAPLQAAPAAAALILLAWGLYRLYHALKRSPLVFSEEDSYLICQAPLNRRAVVLSWFPEPWVGSGLPFWGCGVILGFATLEIQQKGNGSLADIPMYLFTGLRVLTIILPLQIGILAGIWAAGVSRLKPGWKHPNSYLLSPILGVLLGAAAWGA
ncbi:MAG TPA: hypothetical protein VN648_22195, partial [Candidatus Methylomirabilis sp.]|nr:hypothetical protein [Candidatus Methylomirabilis sp.]